MTALTNASVILSAAKNPDPRGQFIEVNCATED